MCTKTCRWPTGNTAHNGESGRRLLSAYREGILHLLLCDVATVVSVKVPEGIVHGVLLLQVVQVHSGGQKLLIVNAACKTLNS